MSKDKKHGSYPRAISITTFVVFSHLNSSRSLQLQVKTDNSALCHLLRHESTIVDITANPLSLST